MGDPGGNAHASGLPPGATPLCGRSLRPGGGAASCPCRGQLVSGEYGIGPRSVCACPPPSVFLRVTQQLDMGGVVVVVVDRTWTHEAGGYMLVCPHTHVQDPSSGPTKSWEWTSKGWATAWLPTPPCPHSPLPRFLSSNLEEDVYQGRKITHFISQPVILIRNGNRHTAWGLQVYTCLGLQNIRKLGDSWRNLPEPRILLMGTAESVPPFLHPP